jgi:hypothetical protein
MLRTYFHGEDRKQTIHSAVSSERRAARSSPKIAFEPACGDGGRTIVMAGTLLIRSFAALL